MAMALLLPQTAAAFRSRSSFAKSEVEGGGGQRYFTGSPNDSQACGVCHTATGETGLQLTGIPEFYVPGQTYEIALAWTLGSAALSSGSFELVDRKNAGIGVTTLLPAAQLTPQERCAEGSGTTVSAAQGAATLDLIESRQIAGAEACGASQLRVRWNAPPATSGPAWLYAVAVVSDGSGNSEGDVASATRVVISPQDEPSDLATLGSCSVGGAAAAPTIPTVYVLSAAAWLRARRRLKAKRRRRPDATAQTRR